MQKGNRPLEATRAGPVAAPPRPLITPARRTEVRLRGQPASRSGLAADILIAPAVGHIGFVEFHRAADSFDAGRWAVERAGEDLDSVLGAPPTDSP